jgi:hypothetical protein
MITTDRMYRSFEVRISEGQEEARIVSGYAATFEQETVMFERDGLQYKEVVDRRAFEKTKMADVVMNYNHQGKPVARTKNGTLKLEVDDIGLKVSADLSGTEEGRKLYEEIRGGYIDKMSFAFVVNESRYSKDTRTRRITDIKRLYDVAAVDMPAYDSTYIQARSLYLAEADRELAEARKSEALKLKLKIKLEETL